MTHHDKDGCAEWVGDLAPSDDQLDSIAETIFSSDDPKIVKYTIRGKGKKDPIQVHCLARHAHVYEVVKGKNRNKVDLSQYDRLLKSITGDVRFFLGNKTDDQKVRWEILRAAMNAEPPLSRNSTDYFEDIGRRMTEQAATFTFNNQVDPEKFNIVREYGYLVPYLAASEFTGITLPKSPSLLLRLFMFARNKTSRGKIVLKGEMAASSELLMWSHIIFGHMFANVGERDFKLKLFGSIVAKKFNALLKKSIRNADKVPPQSLLGRFLDLKDQFTTGEHPRMCEQEFEDHIRFILFELTGTMQLLVGSAFANILGVVEDYNLDLEKFLDHVKNDDIALDEALRLSTPTTTLYRTAKQDFNIGKHEIKEGDRLCLMVRHACKDPKVFPEPNEFSLGNKGQLERNPKDYLSFGPYELTPNSFEPKDGSHPCFGQYWARTILKSMLRGVTQFENLKIETTDESVLTSFRSIPDAIMSSHHRTQIKNQNFVTICSEIPVPNENYGTECKQNCTNTECLEPPDARECKLKQIRDLMEEGGNPANANIKNNLGETGLVHFMSLNVVPGRNKDKYKNGKKQSRLKEPDYIFFELSVDGDIEAAIDTVVDDIGADFLIRIYRAAGLADDLEQLRARLKADNVEMVQSAWPQFYAGNWRNGLGFNGTPGLSIEQIKDEHILANFIQKSLDHSAAEQTPQKMLSYARESLDKVEAGPIAKAKNRWLDADAKPPVFAEDETSPWKSKLEISKLTIQAMPDFVKIWTLLLFLATSSTIWHLLFQDPPTTKFPVNSYPELLGTRTLFIGILYAFLFSIAISVISIRWPKLPWGRTGSIFAFIVFLLAYFAIFPTGTKLADIDISSNLNFNADRLKLGLLMTGGLALVTLLRKPKLFLKSGLAFASFFVVCILGLTVIDLQSHLMASNPPVVTKERCCFPDPAAMYRWDKASLGQMIFYPLMLSVVLTASLFAFNVNYPKFRFLTTRKIYVVLFATIFALIFLTSFATLAPVRWERLGKFFLTFVLAIPTTLVVLAAIAFALFLILTKSEKNNEPIDQDSDVKDLQEIHKREDENAAHNHMISIQRLLPEQWRQRFFLPLALHGVRLVLGKHVYRPGFLATVGTVHYARWIQLAKTNNFVFVSNYDGSWESYLEDFITKSSMGMTAIWSNCIGFPKTKTLIFGGADDGDRFKRYARKSMKPTSFWYSAYPELTADQIRRNTLLRDGLARITSPSDAEAWVDLLGSIPRPTFDLQSDSIQSLVFGGSGNLKCGRMIVVRSKNIGGVDPKFQQWVSEVQKHVTFGDAPPQKHALYLGLSSQGMEYLQYKCGAPQKGTQDDLAEENRIKFPPAFTMGMDHPARASILGDLETHTDCEGPPVRPTAPNWNWGYQKDPGCPTEPRKAAHAVLLIYGEMVTSKRKNARRAKISESAHFKSFVNEQLSLIGKFGLEHDDPIEFNRLPETGLPKEPFGFVDGISQPIVKGTNQARGRGQSIHAVNPGEIVLGYKDNRDFFPPSPQVLADLDKDKILPATPRTQPQRYPKFKPDNDDIYRDLGRNGTYLVIRQLEQDVGRFKKAVNDTAKEFDCESQRLARKMVKAKFMGRWPDGQPLIKRPVNLVKNGENFKLECGKPRKSLSREDNEFLLGMEDPQGHKCPYGSHIRRSNPRDGLDVENEDSLSIVNRHRILRRGRGYQEEDENGVMREGTMFMCLNADIERQFEFVQQTWVGSCKFHGLTDEMDPIAGQGYYKLDPETGERMFKDDDFGFTIQDPARSVRVGGLKPFVTMKGGGYFFIPSREALEFLATKRDD